VAIFSALWFHDLEEQGQTRYNGIVNITGCYWEFLVSNRCFMKPIDIIIISYNRPQDLLGLLKNIAGLDNKESLLNEVIIIDNLSTVSYVAVTDYINNNPSIPFSYITAPENLGVARGRNLGIKESKAAILVTIDDDATFANTNALQLIYDAFTDAYAKQNNVGVYSFKIFYAETNTLQENAFPNKHILKYGSKEKFLAPYFVGCAHAITKNVYNTAGVYPEDFFYGMEEYDLGYRIINAGYSIAFLGSVLVLHKESPLGRQPTNKKSQMMWINKTKVAFKYLHKKYFLSTAVLWSIQYFIKSKGDIKGFINGWKKIRSLKTVLDRKPLSDTAYSYLKATDARLWY
jgi:GT2 family glycosyltransferase